MAKKKQENNAKDLAATYLVSRENFINALKNPFVRNDFEAAEEMGVDIETVERIRSYLERNDSAIRQCDVVSWWEHWTT